MDMTQDFRNVLYIYAFPAFARFLDMSGDLGFAAACFAGHEQQVLKSTLSNGHVNQPAVVAKEVPVDFVCGHCPDSLAQLHLTV